MPLLHIPQSGLPLASSQDAANPDFVPADVLGLSLTDSLIEDLIKCVRDGKSIQLSLGKDPKIQYGTRTQHFSSSLEPFEHEFYRTVLPSATPSSAPSNSNTMPSRKVDFKPGSFTPAMFMGRLAGHNLRIKAAKANHESREIKAAQELEDAKTAFRRAQKTADMSAVSGADAALTALKNSLASEDARKKDNTTIYVKDTSSLPPAVQQKGSAHPIKQGNKAKFLAQNKTSLAGAMTKSTPSSPALYGVGSPYLAPTSVPASQQKAEKAKAIRKPIIHQLALGPATEVELRRYKGVDVTNQEFEDALVKVADIQFSGIWTMRQKHFKELDVFSYDYYTPQNRQSAIDNAIRAYDKMRLNASEPEWQRLLPHDERGMGKSLSKLQAKIATGAIHPPKINVHRAEDSGRDTPSNKTSEKSDHLGEKSSTVSKSGERMARSSSNPPSMKSKKVSEKEGQAKRLVAKPSKKTAAKPKASEKKSTDKESKIKSSKFVSESDEEDHYPFPGSSTTKVKPVIEPTITVKPAQKRSRDETEDNTVQASKKHKGTSPQKSSPLASSPPTNASEISDSSLSSLDNSRKRSADLSSDAAPEAKRHQKSSSISTTSSVASGNMSPSRRDMVIEKAKKFKIYYQKYAKLHKELSANSRERADTEKMEELLDMHDRLTKMKEEIMRESEM